MLPMILDNLPSPYMSYSDLWFRACYFDLPGVYSEPIPKYPDGTFIRLKVDGQNVTATVQNPTHSFIPVLHIDMFMAVWIEAKTGSEWKPIQFFPEGRHGLGIRTSFLAPGDAETEHTFLLPGETKTKIRLCLAHDPDKIVYSNAVDAQIHSLNFQNRFSDETERWSFNRTTKIPILGWAPDANRPLSQFPTVTGF